eukprot:COSAG02_NODE_189_length_30109_cov_71.135855_13_plen_98_part_00
MVGAGHEIPVFEGREPDIVEDLDFTGLLCGWCEGLAQQLLFAVVVAYILKKHACMRARTPPPPLHAFHVACTFFRARASRVQVQRSYVNTYSMTGMK